MAYDPTVTASKAAEMLPADVLNATGTSPGEMTALHPHSITGYIDARRKKKIDANSLGPELEIIKQQQKVRVRIFNCGGLPHHIPCGSAGDFYIPACPFDKPYVEMLTPLYKVHAEIYPKTRTAQAKRLYDDGDSMALELIGEGRGQSKKNSRRRMGVIISAGDIPTEKEVAEGRAQWIRHCGEIVAGMDQLWDRDRKLAYDTFRPEVHGLAARWLGLTGKQKLWLAQGQTTDQIKCPWCEELISPTAAVCRNCKNVVNQEAFAMLKAATAPAPLPVVQEAVRPPRKI